MSTEQVDELIQALKKPSEFRTYDEIYQIEKLVRRIEFFKRLNEEQESPSLFWDLSQQLEHGYAGPNQVIFDIGTMGDKFYVILSGEVGVYVKSDSVTEDMKSSSHKLLERVKQRFRKSKNNNKYKDYMILNLQHNLLNEELVLVKTLQEGNAFGELSLINNKPRLATIMALAPTHMAVLRKANFQQILRRTQEQRLLKEMGFFAQLQLFENWNINLIRYIYLNSTQISCRLGHIVYSQGDPVTEFYIIKSGTFDLELNFPDESHQQFDDKELTKYFKRKKTRQIIRKLGTIGKGQIVGLDEMNSEENTYKYTCICSSSVGELIGISHSLYENKIKTQQTSKLYVEEICNTHRGFWDSRVEQVSRYIDSYRNYLKDKNELKAQQELDSNVYFVKDIDQSIEVKDLIRLPRELPQLKKQISQHAQSHSQDKSFLNRAKDRSIVGKVQTQVLYCRQAYKKLIRDMNQPQDTSNVGQQSKSMMVLSRGALDRSKSRIPVRSSVLNDEEMKVVQEILNEGKRQNNHSTSQLYQRNKAMQKSLELTPFQQRKLTQIQNTKSHVSHIRATSLVN